MKIEVSEQPDKPAVKTKRKWRRQPKKIIAAVLILLVIAGVASAVNGLRSPAEGSVVENPQSLAPKDPYAESGSFSGKYVSFNYPAHYRKNTVPLNTGYLEVDMLVATDHTAKTVTIGVAKEDVSNDSGVQYRRRSTSLYKENDSALGIEFKKLDGTEDTYFITHGGLVASIAVSAPYKNLNSDATFIAKSLQWK